MSGTLAEATWASGLQTPEEGGVPVLVFIDVNGWQAYEEGQYPKWPNQAQLSGFWKTIASHNAEMKNELKGLVEQYHTSLEKVTYALKVYAKSRLPEADYTALLRHAGEGTGSCAEP